VRLLFDLLSSTVPAKRLRAERPNHVWALDFQFDTTSRRTHAETAPRRRRVHPRGAGDAGGPLESMPTTRHGCSTRSSASAAGPELVRMDNGPEMTANALPGWCSSSGAERNFIEPGSPWQNPFRGVVRLPRPRRGALGRGVRLGDRGANGHGCMERHPQPTTAAQQPRLENSRRLRRYGDRRSPAQPTPTRSGGWTDKRGPSPGSLLCQPTTQGAARPALEAVRPAARSAQQHRWASASRPISSRGLGRRHWETALRLEETL
jgi:hypothetical protein